MHEGLQWLRIRTAFRKRRASAQGRQKRMLHISPCRKFSGSEIVSVVDCVVVSRVLHATSQRHAME